MTLDDLHSEPVGGGPGVVVIRISGRGRASAPGRLAPPTLLISDLGRWRRLATIPGTPPVGIGPDAPWFAVDVEVPLHLLIQAGPWWLEPGVLMDGGAALTAVAGRIDALADEVRRLRERLGPIAAPPPPRLRPVAPPDDPRTGSGH
jgi:hypothetical protein